MGHPLEAFERIFVISLTSRADRRREMPDAATVLYMWNPFDGPVMRRCKERIIEKYGALGTLPRIRVVYHHALFIDVWREDSGCAVRRIELPPDELNKAYLITFPT